MLLKCFTNKSLVKQSLVLMMLGSASFTTLNAKDLKVCESEEDTKVGCVHKEYYDNGKLKAEIPYKNGKVEGVVKEYYENGNLRIEIPFKDGKQEGISKLYYENGNILGEKLFKNGKVEGIAKTYSEDGNLSYENPFKNGKLNGIVKSYYEDGDIALEISFVNGKLQGSVKHYDGKLIWQANAQNGKIISGKCSNGKPLTNAHLAKLNNDINENIFGGEYWHKICGNN